MKKTISVIKRNQEVVKFNPEKITNAVLIAMDSVGAKDIELAKKVTEEVRSALSKHEYVNVEDIQDMVERKLMSNSLYEVAKEYILYREDRRRSRTNGSREKYKMLSEEFLSKYKHATPNMNDFATFVYLRTYSRFIESEGRRERWWETVARAVDYNASLLGSAGITKAEAEKLYDNIFHGRQFLSGRTFWTGNTLAAKKYPMSNFNCAFVVIDSFKAYEDVFYASMVGTGIGFRVFPEDVNKMPKVRTDIKVINKTYNSLPKYKRREHTCLSFAGSVCEIAIGDSKEGWTDALKYLFEIFTSSRYRNVDTIIFDYDSVRPMGESLKTFGGTASGYVSMMNMINKIEAVLKRGDSVKGHKKLKTIDAMDIANIIAENVVSGGVRRSAQICLFDADDKDILEAKKDLYICDENGNWVLNQDISHRRMSNNSVMYKQKPTREQIKWQLNQMRYNGEPGFINYEELKRRRPSAEGVNPCGEILLEDKTMCNLTTVNLMAFVREDNTLDVEGVLEAQRLSARAGFRMANVDIELHEWDINLKRNRLVGCSFTGLRDMMNATNMTVEEEVELYKKMRSAVHEAVEQYAKAIGSEVVPDAMCTVKPEGTLSCVANGVSSGLHYPEAEHYIRRVRISSSDPLCKVCEDLGYPVLPEVGSTEKDATTKVVEFALKSPVGKNGKTKYNVTAIEQLENYKRVMEHYVDHNASITVTVRESEWNDVEEWLNENWNSVVGISFLPLDDNYYPLLPFEAITKEEYDCRIKAVDGKKIDPIMLKKYEDKQQEDSLLEDSACSSGACPIR